MQKDVLTELKQRLRRIVRDDFGIQWNDVLLDEIIFEAQREYALLSGALTGKYELYAGPAPVQDLPEDFYKVIQIIDKDNRNIPVLSYRNLLERYGDFRTRTGTEAEGVCLNFDGLGKCRIFPVLPQGTYVGTVIYSRLPGTDRIEVKNISALEQYALFQMYQFTGKKNAQICYAAFVSEINRELRLKLMTGNKNIARTGVYY